MRPKHYLNRQKYTKEDRLVAVVSAVIILIIISLFVIINNEIL